MEYILSGLCFVGVLTLLRWSGHVHWLFAVTTAVAWAVAVWSLTVLLKDPQIRNARDGSRTGIAVIITGLVINSAANLGLTTLEEVGPSVKSGLVLMMTGIGLAGMGLGLLGGASIVSAKSTDKS